MPVNLDLVKQRLIDQEAAEMEAQIAAPPTAGDFGRALGAGVADIPVVLGEAASLLGFEDAGAAVRGFGEDIQDSLIQGMTPGGLRAATSPILESDTPIATTGFKALQTLPGMVGMGGVGGLAVKGLGAVGKAARIGALAPEVIAHGVTAPTKLATALGFGSTEGVYSGLSNAAQTRGEIMTQDIETLGQNPIYQKHFATTDPSLGDDARQQLAREAASREAERDVFAKTALTTGVISALGGGGVFGALARPAPSVARGVARGAVAEGLTEAPQSALETVHQNVALNRPATEGALNAGIEGGILGGILGGGFGGLHAAVSTPTQVEIDVLNAPPAPAPARAFTDLTPEETLAALASARADIAAGRPVVDPVNESLRRLFAERRIPFTRPELTTSPGASAAPPTPRAGQIGVEYEGHPAPTIETVEQVGARTGVYSNRVPFERPERPVLTATPGAAPPPAPPRADQIGVHRFAFAGIEPGIETPAEAARRLSAVAAQDPPVASNPTLPKSFRGKTAAEFEAELSVSTLSPKTLERAEEYLNSTLRPAAEQHAAAVAATTPVPAAVDAQPLAATPVVAQPAPAREQQAAPLVSQPAAPDGIAATHQPQYQSLLHGYTQAGLAPETADALLRAHYSSETGFDANGLLAAITEAYSAPLPSELQGGAPSKPQRGRPAKAQRAAASSTTEGIISDPDPEIQANARAIAADPAKLAQLREMANQSDFRPLTQRLKKAVDELLGQSQGVAAQTDAFARPEALGPATVADEDLPTWSQLLAEFRAIGMPPAEAKALIESHYDPFAGFDTATLAVELQSRDTAAIRESLAGAVDQRLAAVRQAAERMHARKAAERRGQGRKQSQDRDAELARLVAEQETDDAGLDFGSLSFSRGLSPRASAQKLADVRAVVDRVVKQWRRPPFGGVQVHETIASLPRGLQREVYSHGAHEGKNVVKGVYDADTKTVHLIASHLATPEEAEFVLFHEVLGHFGLRGFLGQNFGATMRDLYRLNPTLRKAAIALRREFKYDLETATEEALADMAGLNFPIKGLALLLGKLQKALRAIGFKLTAKWLEKRTNAEMLTVLAQARAFVTAGQGAFIYTPVEARALYSYGGPRAAQAKLGNRRAALDFEEAGIPPEDIRKLTGWFKGLDGKWKFEIKDSDAQLNANWNTSPAPQPVGAVLDHPQLFAQYPELASVTVRTERREMNRQASYNHATDTITLNDRLTSEAAKSALLHELQHGIQGIEGFARGGSIRDLDISVQAALQNTSPGEIYQNLAGEIEARDVQARALMSDEERTANAPYTSEPRTGKPILRFKRGSAAQADVTSIAFKKWFGDSKVVDKDGNPLRLVHHGAILGGVFRNVAEQRRAGIKSRKVSEAGLLGHWFSEDPQPSYGPNRVDAHLSIQNPLYAHHQRQTRITPEELRAVIQAMDGYLPPRFARLAANRGIPVTADGRVTSPADIDRVHKELFSGATKEQRYPRTWADVIDQYTEFETADAIPGNDTRDSPATGQGLGNVNIRERLTDAVKSLGYDGYYAHDRAWVAFESNQIKSATDNSGAFDPANPDIRFSRSGTPGVDAVAADIGEFYNFSAPFQRVFQKLAGWGSKSGALRSLRLALDRRITSPYHIAASGRSAGYTNLFQHVLRPMQQFSDYLISTMMEPIQRTWIKGQGLGQPPPEFEAAARALFAHNDAQVPTAEFFGSPQYTANLTPKARELYDQIREAIKRGLMAEFTAKAVRMREVLADPEIYNQTLAELYAVTQRRIDSGFIPNKRHGEFAIGVYHTTAKHTDSAGRLSLAGQPMQWYTFESIGEAKTAAQELRTLFQGQTDIVLDIDAVGQGEPLTVERAANDRYTNSSYWDFLQQAQSAGIEISEEQKGRLAKLMIQSESALQNKIQKRKGVAGYSKDLMRTIGEFITATGFSAAQTTMSARVVHAMNRQADLTPEQLTELSALQTRFQELSGVSESRVYEQLSAEPDLTKRFEALGAYSRMKFLEVSGKQFWAQDGADTGYYRDRANELIAFLKEPKSSWADKYRTLAALHFLGGSAASAIVNLASLPMFAAPYLHQFGGARAYSALTKHFMTFAKQPALRDIARLSAALNPQARSSGQAAKDWADLQPLGEDLLQAVRRAAEEGIVSDSQLYEVFGLARGGLIGRSAAVRKATDLWMKPFATTEQANRFSTFMAAFEIGRDVKKLGGAALYDFARDAVDQTQAIYGPINRQPWARNPIGHALFTFRAFPLMMVELIRRLPGPQRTLVLGSLLLAAGINGLPFADDLRDIIDTIAQRVFGAPLNARRAMTNMVAQASEAMLGADLSKLVMNGMLDTLTGASISGRIGLGNLIPGTRVGAAGEDFFERTMADVLGPVGAEAGNFAKALQGQPGALIPSAVRNLGRAVEAAEYGKITDAKGQTLIDDVSPIETFLQGLGFTSGRLGQAYEDQRGVFQERAYVEEVREGFYTRIREAAAHNDKEAIAEVEEERRAWNEGHPQWPIAIRPQQLRSTLTLAGLPLNERTWKLMPRAWRQTQPQ